MLTALLAKLKVEPREYQKRIVEKTVAMFSGEHKNRAGELEPPAQSVMIESPTGSGKTVMGLLAAKCLAERFGLSVGWVAMRRNLLAQAEEENRRKGFNLDLSLISMFDKEPPRCDLLIVDEAQHDGARSMSDLHSAVRPKMVLGLSATPYRSDRIKLCFDKVVAD
ncbi:MAG TPA: DEAD/DEAH box helicase family protein, partial [Pirellulales bacterium]